MAFNFEVIRGATTYTLYGSGQPIRLEDVDDLGGAGVRNIEESGPFQDGATHLDYRLDPTTLTLRFVVVGASASALDGHRDTLNEIFKPVRGVPITLKVTRDDGEVRQIDCQRTGRLSIPLLKQNKPGNLHRAVVQLRAADPTWYDPDDNIVNFANAANDEWYLAGGAIGSANVMQAVTFPTNALGVGTAANAIGSGDPWTIAFRSNREPFSGDGKVAFIDSADSGPAFYQAGSNYRVQVIGFSNSILSSTLMPDELTNYFMAYASGTMVLYLGTIPFGTVADISNDFGIGRWRGQEGAPSQNWSQELPFAAIYDIALSPAQIGSLNSEMVSEIGLTSDIAYEGGYGDYPVIVIGGPVAEPSIINTTTGKTLSFSGSISVGDIWTIDTRYGRKSVLNAAGSSVLSNLTDDSDLAEFSIMPAPLAPGGTNTIVVIGSATSGSTSVSLTYYNRYMSY